MIVLVMLRPEEAGIAVSGSLPEPGFRPYPGSKRERELEREWERRQSGYHDENQDGEEALSKSSSVVEFVPLSPPRTLQRIGPAQRWKRYGWHLALLIAQRPGGLQIIAVGTVEGDTRASYGGTRNLRVRVRYVLRNPISLDDIQEELTQRQRTRLEQILADPLRPLPPLLGEILLNEVVGRHPGLSEVFGDISDQIRRESVASARLRSRRPTTLTQEAMASALDFFSPKRHALEPEPAPAPSDFALDLEGLTGVVENDVITDDASVFPGWDRSDFSVGGWWEFRNKGRRLLVKNLNVSPQETRTGADLVYVRRDPDAFVFVQYKLLERRKDGRWIFRPDGRLECQVERMLEIENTPRGNVSPEVASTYRIGPGFSFVKFVESSGARPERPGELVAGYYMPSDLVRRVLMTPDKGPRGGVVHFVAEHRHISQETFARLVRDSWVGSTGEATALLRSIFGIRDRDSELVLAVDEPVNEALADTQVEGGIPAWPE